MKKVLRCTSLLGLFAGAAFFNVPQARADGGAPDNLDFEGGIVGWTSTGVAFGSQPITGRISANLAPVTLGGDYWKDVRYPVGQHGSNWIGSYWKQTAKGPVVQGDAPTGTLVSNTFALGSSSKYLSFSIGGGNDIEHERIELQVFASNANDVAALEKIKDRSARTLRPIREGNDVWVSVLAATGSKHEALSPRSQSIPEGLTGKKVRIRIVDSGSTVWGHINVDNIRITSTRPEPFYGEVWGFADYHTHPMGYSAFGALKGIRTVWGAIGRNAEAYEKDKNLIRHDVPQCNAKHLGGRISNFFVSGLEGSKPNFVLNFLANYARDHGHFGGDPHGLQDFADFPSYFRGTHHQYHVTQIKRAYEGGLRLVSALAHNSEIAEFFMARALQDNKGNWDVEPTPELALLKAHVCGMRQLARYNSDWMEIAYSPEDARRIIHGNKLAVILGVEFDKLGSLFPNKSPSEEIKELYEIGIRQVAPIHAHDNKLGGSVVFVDGYNTANYKANNKWFSVKPGERCNAAGEPRATCTQFRFAKEQNAGVVGRFFEVAVAEAGPVVPAAVVDPGTAALALGINIAITEPSPWFKAYDVPAYASSGPPTRTPQGHVNVNSLTEKGTAYLEAAMSRGLLIDLAHMSDASAKEALGVAKNHKSYPVMISHVGFRALKLRNDYSDFAVNGSFHASMGKNDNLSNRCLIPGMSSGVRSDCAAQVKEYLKEKGQLDSKGNIVPGTTNRGFLPTEFDVPTWQVDEVKRLGGVIGTFAAHEALDPNGPSVRQNKGFVNDCAGSSKGFATALGFGLSRGFGAIGVATDLGMHGTTTPRFGTVSTACGADRKAGGPDQKEMWAIERALTPQQYDIGAQRDGIKYAGGSSKSGVRYGSNDPLKPYRMADHVFDFNVDGLANFGLVPDMLQDVKNFSHGSFDLDPLFSSAEAYIRMWEKAWTAGGCTGDKCDAKPTFNDGICAEACKGTCPASFNGGAPLHPLASTIERCNETNLRFEGKTVVGESVLKTGDWSIVRVLNPTDIVWYCGDTKERTKNVCPANTGYIKVFRGGPSGANQSKAIHIDCLEEPYDWAEQTVMSADQVASAKLIATEEDACGRPEVEVISGQKVSGPDLLTNTSQESVYAVESPNIYWFCTEGRDKDPNRTVCPAATNVVKVRRGKDRLLSVGCYSSKNLGIVPVLPH